MILVHQIDIFALYFNDIYQQVSLYENLKASYSWKYRIVIYYIYRIYSIIWMRLTCAYVIYSIFLIKIATIKNKSNVSYLNTNQKPFAYRQIIPNLVSADSP